eukprot:scaffold3100_cov203-Alexandrium_tamarense.AAC.11
MSKPNAISTKRSKYREASVNAKGLMKRKKSSDTGTRTQVSCVKGKYDNHLHHIGSCRNIAYLQII